METEPSLKQTLMECLPWALGVLLLIFIGFAAWQKVYGERLAADILKHEGVITKLTDERKADKETIAALRTQAEDAAYNTGKAKVVYVTAKIPSLPALPTTNDELAAKLKDAGLQELPAIYSQADTFDYKVQLARQSILFRQDAETALTWSMKANIILPATEAKLKACDDLQATQAIEITALKSFTVSQADLIKLDEALISERKSESDTLKKALKNEERKRWQKYAYGIAGAALVYLVKK